MKRCVLITFLILVILGCEFADPGRGADDLGGAVNGSNSEENGNSGASGATGSGATGSTGSGATGSTGSGATGSTGSGATDAGQFAFGALRGGTHPISQSSQDGLAGAIRENSDGSFTLTRNVELDGYIEPLPILTTDFDGGGFTITGLRIAKYANYVGLFEMIFYGGSVRNLTIELADGTENDPSIQGRHFVGALAGVNYGTIDNVKVQHGFVLGNGFVGGLVGANYSRINNVQVSNSVKGYDADAGGLAGSSVGISDTAEIRNSHASGDVSGGLTIGGLVGFLRGTIKNSYAAGTVIGKRNRVGGLVGSGQDFRITDSYATGAVTGFGQSVGGLGGEMYEGTISTSYASGSVKGVESLGGLVGTGNYDLSVINSYATGDVTGIGSAKNIGGLIGKMKQGTEIKKSYASGAVSGRENSGGLVGLFDIGYYSSYNPPDGKIEASYFDATTTGRTNSVGGVAGENRDGNAPDFQTIAGIVTVTAFYTDPSDGDLVKNADPTTGGAAITQSDFSDDPATQDINESWDFADNASDGNEEIWRWLGTGQWPILNWQQ